MESNSINKISVTGLKSVEIDEFSTNKIIINNEALQYFKNIIFITNYNWGIYNLQKEMDNIMISNTAQDLELLQLQSGLSTAQASITRKVATLVLTSAGTLLALDLVIKKCWILFFQNLWDLIKSTKKSSNVYLDFDPNYFSIDANNHFTLNTGFWKRHEY